MDYTFRVRLSHVQVTSLSTLMQQLSGSPQRALYFRLAFDGKVEDLVLEPDLITGDMTSSRGIRFIYRIHSEDAARLQDTLSRRYATCQVLIKERTSQDTFTVVAVLASATASILELVCVPDAHFLFTLTESCGDDDDDHDDDAYAIDSTDASIYKEDESAHGARAGAILGRRDGVVSLQLAVEEVRVVDLSFHEDVRVTALPPSTSVQLAYRIRHVSTTPAAEQTRLLSSQDCRAQGFTLSTQALSSTADGSVTFTSQQLPRLAALKLTPHDIPRHELEVCLLVGGTVYTSMHLSLASRAERRPSTSTSAAAAATRLALSASSSSDWDHSGVALHGTVTLDNVPTFLNTVQQSREEGDGIEGKGGDSHTSGSRRTSASVSSPHVPAPGAVSLGNVKEQVLRPASRASAQASVVSSITVSGPSAPPVDEPVAHPRSTSAEGRPASPTPPESSRDDERLTHRRDGDDSRANTRSLVEDSSPPHPSHTLIQHDENSTGAAGDGSPPALEHGELSKPKPRPVGRPPPPPPPPPLPESRPLRQHTAEARVVSPNASAIHGEIEELMSVGGDDEAAHALSGGSTSSREAVQSRRSSAAGHATIINDGGDQGDGTPVTDTVPPEPLRVNDNPHTEQRDTTRQLSTTSRGSITTVTEELVLHFQHGPEAPAEALLASAAPSPSSADVGPVGSGMRGALETTTLRQSSPSVEPMTRLSASPQPARGSVSSFSRTPSVAPHSPAWQPGPEPIPPTPRLSATTRAPRRLSASFGHTHTRLRSLSHDFRALLEAYEGQLRRVEEADRMVAQHAEQHGDGSTDETANSAGQPDALRAQVHQLTAQLARQTHEASLKQRELQQLQDELAAAPADTTESGELSREETERVAVYTEMEASLLNLLQRAEQHRDELLMQRDRHSVQLLADAQAGLEADTVSLARLEVSPSPPSLVSRAASSSMVRRREPSSTAANGNTASTATGAALGDAKIHGHSPVSGVPPAEGNTVTPQAPSSSGPSTTSAPPPPPPPSQHEALGVESSPVGDHPEAAAAASTRPPVNVAASPPRAVIPAPTPPSAKPPETVSPRNRSPLHEPASFPMGDAPFAAPLAASTPPRANAVVLGFSQPCTPEAEQRAREEWQQQQQEENGTSHGTAGPGHPYGGAAAAAVRTSPVFRYGSTALRWEKPAALSTHPVGRSLVASPVQPLFPKLRSASVDSAAVPSPTPRVPESVPRLSQPLPLGVQPSSPVASERFFDNTQPLSGLVRTPHRSVLMGASRRSSVAPLERSPSSARSPPHPYSMPRDYDGDHHYPLVVADDTAVSAREMQVRALMHAIAEGDTETSLHIITHVTNVLQDSNNFLHAACGAAPARTEIVAAILQRRPELARGVDRESGNTALHVACRGPSSNASVVRQLIIAGVAVDTRNGEGYTAFHLAVLNPSDALHHRMKEALLSIGGANINERTEGGQTALHLVAGSDDNFTVVQFLVSHGADLWARAPIDIYVGSPYGYKGRERLAKTVTPPEVASLKGAVRNGRYFDRSLMNSRLVF